MSDSPQALYAKIGFLSVRLDEALAALQQAQAQVEELQPQPNNEKPAEVQ